MSRRDGAAHRRSGVASTGPSVGKTRHRRGEVRPLLLESARQLFEEKGYARATTREITQRAGVAETLLFRNFGSKANIFAEAVLLPLADFFRDWVHRVTEGGPTGDVEANQYEFTKTLYEMAAENRGLLLTFFATAVFEPEVLEAPNALATISHALDDLAAASAAELIRLGIDLRDYDVVTRSRAVVGMILAMALFESIIVPSTSHARSQDEVLHELTRQILFGGFNQRPAFMAAPPKRARKAQNGATRQSSVKKSSRVAAPKSGASSQKK
jgi:AcrR family transcriptional regulator